MSETFSGFVEKNGAFILTFAGVITGCISGLFVYVLKSRCTNIQCCWGGFNCTREVVPPAQFATITSSSPAPSTVSSADII